MLIVIPLAVLFGVLPSFCLVSCIINEVSDKYIKITDRALAFAVLSSLLFFVFIVISICGVVDSHRTVSELYTIYVTKKELTEEEIFEKEKSLVEIRISNYWTSFYTNSQKDFLKDVTFVKSE